MPLANPALWRRLQDFSPDDPAASLPFSVRLAREHGWSLRYAQRAVDEYRRFLYLTQTAGPACPSEQVDAVWHLHLCYTRSYWDELCGRVLGGPLHHDPTAGGAGQLAYHRQMYDDTLAAYQREFDASPPPAVWPATDQRFSLAAQPRTIDPSRYWVMRKPPLSAAWRMVRRRWAGAAMAGCLAVAPLLGVGWNPLDMRGPPFLALYAVLVACAALAALALRMTLVGGDQAAPIPELDPYEGAVLAGGERRAVNVALAELMLAEVVRPCDESQRTVMAAQPEPPGAHPLVQTVHRVIEGRGMATVVEVIDAAKPQAARLGVKLEDAQLVPSTTAAIAARVLPALIAASPLMLAIMKISVGMQRSKPIGLLLLFCIATVVLAAMFLRPVRLTRLGKRALKQLKDRHRALSKEQQFFEADETEQAWGMGLFGLGLMAAAPGASATMYRWMFPSGSSSGSFWSTGCGSGCGGGGGGCGGGGCGGGCGGCGGD